MNWTSFCFETAATVAESAIILLSVSKMAGQKYKGKGQALCILAGTVLLSALVVLLNSWELFSFATPIISMFFVVVYLKFFSPGSVLLLASSTMLTFLVMNAIDYVIFFLFGLFGETPITNARTFYLLLSPGSIRYGFLFADKGTQGILLLCLYRILTQIQSLKKRYLALLLGISGSSYFIMSYLVSMILSESVLVMQTGILFSWIFMALCVVLLLISLFISGKYHSEQENNQLLTMSNAMMEENYKNLHQTQQTFSKLNHDFTHHIRSIQSFAEKGNLAEIKSYSASLLKEVYCDISACKSGNDAVDAVINFKNSEAQKLHITFSYRINFAAPLPIKSIDVCAILANQIDNAIDACKQIPDPSKRRIEVHIWQPTDDVLIFQVSNTSLFNPFEENAKLHTTKTDKSRQHGLGIQSIQESAARYEGVLENTYRDGNFISTVSMVLPETGNDTALREE